MVALISDKISNRTNMGERYSIHIALMEYVSIYIFNNAFTLKLSGI